MGVPNRYREHTSPNLVNFEFQSFIEDIGYGTYYAHITRDGTKKLTPLQVPSDRLYRMVTSSTITSGDEFNFDLDIAKQAVVEGKLIVNCTYGGTPNSGGTPSTSSMYIEIFHVNSAGTETSIGTQQNGETFTTGSTPGVVTSWRKSFGFDIPYTVFAVGEKLRVEVTMNYSLPGGSGMTARFWFDPQNRANAGADPNETELTAQATTFEVLVPYKASQML